MHSLFFLVAKVTDIYILHSQQQQIIIMATVTAIPPPPALPLAQDLLVTGLEQIKGYEAFGQFHGQMYAGLLPMDNGERSGKIMFWLFEPEQQTYENSMIMWLNGGPGCSSFNCGVLMEICKF
jgi:carboxypeptidase C (cathepsin A)